METLVLVMSLIGCISDPREQRALAIEAATVAEICDGPEACEDAWSSVYDLIAENGVSMAFGSCQ